MSEVLLAAMLCSFLGNSDTETRQYFDNQGDRRYVRVDCETENFVVEVGLDNTDSNRDSIHQAVFASIQTGKIPYVVLIDTDGEEGRFEQEMRRVTERLGIGYTTCSQGFIERWAATSGFRALGLDKSLDDLPQPHVQRGLCNLDLKVLVAE